LGEDVSAVAKSLCPFHIARADFDDDGCGFADLGASKFDSWYQIYRLTIVVCFSTVAS
jgi:hypothetical protein